MWVTNDAAGGELATFLCLRATAVAGIGATMIRIVGHADHQDENVAAQKLKDEFIRWRSDIETNRDDVLILVAVQTPGHRGSQDIDLVALARFHRPLEVGWHDSRDGSALKVPIWSFCATFEVKGHEIRKHDGTPQIRFQDNKVDVLYSREWHPATLQAAGQAKSFAKRLRRETGVDVWCLSLLWLFRVAPQQLSGQLNEPNSALPASFDIPALGRKLLDLDSPTRRDQNGRLQYSIWVRDMDFDAIGKHLTAQYAISPLNRKTVDNVIRRRIDFKQFGNLGNQQQLIVGRAGSGKTMVLLRTALEFFQSGKRVAILTYNRALVADITRLLMFMKVKGPSFAPNVNIITLHAYFIAVIRALFPEERHIDRRWLDEIYQRRLKEALEYLKAGAATKDDIRAALLKADFAIFDIACVDEGQDWFDEERDLLHLTVGSNNCIVASGFDQLVRQDGLCDWTSDGSIATAETRLRKCLRMKSGLASFANVVAEELGLSEEQWHVEPDDDVSGGNVVIKVGDYLSSRILHDKLVAANAVAGNKNIDMLFCVEPGNLKLTADGARVSALAVALSKLGTVWDATLDENREDPPRSVDDFRVVQYESCRGLEGWIVVAEDLDEFYRRKAKAFKPRVQAQQVFFKDDVADAQEFASLWSMIPITRAIDTLVITIRHAESELGTVLLRSAKRLPDVVSVLDA